MSEDSEDSIIIRTLTAEDYKEVKPFFFEHFFPFEPLSSTRDQWACNEAYDLELISQGLSLIAVEPTGNIVGLVMACVQNPTELMEQQLHGRIHRFLSKVEREADIYQRYGVSEVLNLHVLVVATQMRGKKLGARLTTKLMDLGRTKALPLVVAYCTSFYSARLLKLMGFECAHGQSYAEYKDEEGQVVFKPPEPHTQLQVMVYRLN